MLSEKDCHDICALTGVARYAGRLGRGADVQIIVESNFSRDGLSLYERDFTVENVREAIIQSDLLFRVSPQRVVYPKSRREYLI